LRLLLDTQALLWAWNGSLRLGKRAKQLIASDSIDVWVSAASAWEIANKAALGRLKLRESPDVWFPTAMAQSNFRPLPISIEHALKASILPRHHSDPFDRLLIAQAQVESLTIVTADAAFEMYKVPLVEATE